VHPVGADEHIGLHLPAVGKARDYTFTVGFDLSAAGTQMNGRRVEFRCQQLLQFGAVDEHEPGPPTLGHDLCRDAHEPGAVGTLDALPGYLHGQHRHLVGQPDRPKGRQRVRPQPHSGADLFQHRRLLVDLGGQSPAGKGDGGRQPADPAADDDNFRSHARTVPSTASDPSTKARSAALRNRYGGVHAGWAETGRPAPPVTRHARQVNS
jgi:hypothetical protein